MIFIVVYTPSNQDKNQESKFVDKIQTSFPSWAKISETVFLVDPNDDTLTAYEIKKSMLPICEVDDKIFVAYLTQYASWLGYDQRMFMWVKDHDKRQKSLIETRNTYDSNHMQVSDYYDAVENKDNEEDTVQIMVSRWASTWDEKRTMYFDCKDFDCENILVKFISQVYLSLRRNVFLNRIRILNFPENLKNGLYNLLNKCGENENRQSISTREFDDLFVKEKSTQI